MIRPTVKQLGSITRWCTVLWLLGVGTGLWADSVRLGGFWIDQVTISGISDGNIRYVSDAGTDFVRPVSALEALKIKTLPELTLAEDAIVAKKLDTGVLKRLNESRTKANHPWLQQWIDHRIVMVADALKLPDESVEAFIRLARSNADPYYLKLPPKHSLAAITEAGKQQELVKALNGAADAMAAGPVQQTLKSLSQSIANLTIAGTTPTTPTAAATSGAGATATGTTTVAQTGTAANATTSTPGAAASPASGGLALPKSMAEADPLSQTLRKGEWDKAIEMAGKAVEAEADTALPLRLYQLGVAQVHGGLAKNDLSLVKTGGLNLMRVAIYYPRNTYAGPALLEAGLVHQKIGRNDLAKSLYDRATLLIDSTEEPALATRLEELKRELVSTESVGKP